MGSHYPNRVPPHYSARGMNEASRADAEPADPSRVRGALTPTAEGVDGTCLVLNQAQPKRLRVTDDGSATGP